jgi:hypothetical protein
MERGARQKNQTTRSFFRTYILPDRMHLAHFTMRKNLAASAADFLSAAPGYRAANPADFGRWTAGW